MGALPYSIEFCRSACSGQLPFLKANLKWDNDWSRQGLAPSGSTPVNVPNLNLVQGSAVVWGNRPA